MFYQTETITNKTKNMILQFGKFKGQQLSSTPKSYQDWLNNQEWFNKSKLIKEWAVYYTPNRDGKLFAGLNDELIAKFECQERAIEFCDNCNMTGYLDELHIGYRVKPIY